MKIKNKGLLVAAIMVGSIGSVSAQDVLSGDARDACEAVLCLASGQQPSECEPSLRRYFNITAVKPNDLLKKRKNFLNMCPDTDQNLIDSIVGSGGSSGGPGDINPPVEEQIR